MAAPQAVIFDMDGVLLDSEAYYRSVTERFFGERGLKIPKAQLDAIVGGSFEEYQAAMERWWRQAPRIPAEERQMGPIEAMDPYFEKDPAQLARLANPGLHETLDGLFAQGIKTAVASSAPMADVRLMLGAIGVAERISPVVSGHDLPHAKPYPDVYLAALEALGLPAGACIAVEDSDIGIEAARRAGLRVAAKHDERFGFSQKGATWLIEELPDLLDLVARL